MLGFAVEDAVQKSKENYEALKALKEKTIQNQTFKTPYK